MPSAAKHRDIKQGLGKGIEEALWAKGFKLVAGVDEAGRGPLAGPVVAAACIVSPDVCIEGVMDSKLTKEADRERLYEEITKHPGVTFSMYELYDLACQNLPSCRNICPIYILDHHNVQSVMVSSTVTVHLQVCLCILTII